MYSIIENNDEPDLSQIDLNELLKKALKNKNSITKTIEILILKTDNFIKELQDNKQEKFIISFLEASFLELDKLNYEIGENNFDQKALKISIEIAYLIIQDIINNENLNKSETEKN